MTPLSPGDPQVWETHFWSTAGDVVCLCPKPLGPFPGNVPATHPPATTEALVTQMGIICPSLWERAL